MLIEDYFYRYYETHKFRRLLLFFSVISFIGLLTFLVFAFYAWVYVGRIPGTKSIDDYRPDANSRIHTSDGGILKDLNEGSRIVIPFDLIPLKVREAFIAAEDQRFYEHGGVDFIGMGRAAVRLIPALIQGRRPEGASTITQQVARNIVLNSSDLSVLRKFNEIIVALKLERTISKDRILELYLNQIFLGNRSYGISAAAQNYFKKPLDKLNLEEIAYLAALPKGPNNYNPERFYDAAIGRRNWVLERMYEMGFVSKTDRDNASAEKLVAYVSTEASINSEYFVDSVRSDINKQYSGVRMVGGGYSIRTTLDANMQVLAVTALNDMLRRYDRRHGYRGPITLLKGNPNSWVAELSSIEVLGKLDSWQRAVVTDLNANSFIIKLETGGRGYLNYEDAVLQREYGFKPDRDITRSEMDWLRQNIPIGSVILVSAYDNQGRYRLEQVPRIEGAFLAMDPHTGRVLAEVGGWSYQKSKFNRATQALRQPGSAIKPFVYLSALQSGKVNPFQLVEDTAVVIENNDEIWIPSNFDGTDEPDGYARPLRTGIEKSRNRMTVRVAQATGFSNIGGLFNRLGLYNRTYSHPSMVLGSIDTTVERMVRAFAMLANGGQPVAIKRIDRIQDRDGNTLKRIDQPDVLVCKDCSADSYHGQLPPQLVNDAKPMFDASIGYIIIDMMQGAVYRGTGAALAELQLNIAGKTGTTNDNRDSWFIGVLPDLVVAIWAGFDEPENLGINPETGGQEAGSTIALPVYKNFINQYMKDRPNRNFIQPGNIVRVRMNWDDWEPGNSNRSVSQPATPKMVRDFFGNDFLPELENKSNAVSESELQN